MSEIKKVRKNINLPSFSNEEINEISQIKLPKTEFFKSSDSVEIAYYSFIPQSSWDMSLIFIHGGGAFSGAGYQNLAINLMNKYNISVYLMDIRGHGNSGGNRGDSPEIRQIWDDLSIFIKLVKNKNPRISLILGGHSSGAGLVLNYSSAYADDMIAGYIFLSPQFGYKSGTERKNSVKFAKVKMNVFIINAITKGKNGNRIAVLLNYSNEVLKSQPKMINSYSYNMAMALTPHSPIDQFKNIKKPYGLFIGEKDELFEPERIIKYARLPSKDVQKKSISRIIENRKHLSVLVDADEYIIQFIRKIARN
jgi:acylglycerol lipase